MKFLNSKTIWLLVFLAIALRIPLLTGSFWLDEAAQALESARPFSQQLDIIPDFQPPLLHYLLHFAMYLGRSEWWLRLWGALIPGLISIIATYLIGKKVFCKNVGLIAGLLTATSSFHVFYSQELRPYSLAAMWAILSWLFLINIWLRAEKGNEDIKRPSKNYWLFYTICSVLGLFSSYTYPFVLLSQLIITLMLFSSNVKKHFLSAAITAVFFLPWLPMFLKQLQAGTSLRTSMPGWDQVVSLPQLQALPLTLGKLVFGVIRLEISTLFIGLSVLMTVITLSLIFLNKSRKNFPRKKLLIIFLAGALPLLITWMISFWIPVVRPKRLLFVQPFIYLLVSSLSVYAWQSKKLIQKTLAAILLGLFLSINLFSLYQYYTQPSLQREDWRSLRALVRMRFPERETALVFNFGEPFAPWRWYDRERFPTVATGRFNQVNYEQALEKLKPIFDYQYVLVFDYLRDLTDPDDLVIKAVEELGFELHELIDVENIGFVRVYIRSKEAVSG